MYSDGIDVLHDAEAGHEEKKIAVAGRDPA
jgi:hypothetical protein